MSVTYNTTPSKLYKVKGAAGYFFDRGTYLFGQWVEGEMQEAESRGSSPAFARSNRIRTFAKCMGDDMSKSTAGFASPFAAGVVKTKDGEDGEEILASGF